MQIEYIKRLLLDAPEDELDPYFMAIIAKWNMSNLAASDVLEVLNLCKQTDGASDLVISILEKVHAHLGK